MSAFLQRGQWRWIVVIEVSDAEMRGWSRQYGEVRSDALDKRTLHECTLRIGGGVLNQLFPPKVFVVVDRRVLNEDGPKEAQPLRNFRGLIFAAFFFGKEAARLITEVRVEITALARGPTQHLGDVQMLGEPKRKSCRDIVQRIVGVLGKGAPNDGRLACASIGKSIGRPGEEPGFIEHIKPSGQNREVVFVGNHGGFRERLRRGLVR